MFTLPVIQIVLFCLTIGKDPVGLKLGVVNNELLVNQKCPPVNHNCSFDFLSCRMLDALRADRHDLVRSINFNYCFYLFIYSFIFVLYHLILFVSMS